MEVLCGGSECSRIKVNVGRRERKEKNYVGWFVGPTDLGIVDSKKTKIGS
jgi:hypothetical protein